MRLFTAVIPPADVLDQILALHHVVGIECWETQPHITLSYFGDVDPSVAAGLSRGLQSVRFKPFRLAPTHVGTFGDQERSVVWIGFERSPELEALNAEISVLRARFVSRPDRLRFVPHMTVARTGGPDPAVVDHLIAHTEVNLPHQFDVTSFDLLESVADGYELKARFGCQSP